MRRRAFSLLELAVALAIAGIVAVAALTSTVSLQKSFTSARKVTELTDDAHFTLEHLLAPLRNAGGGAVRPWQAISTTCRDDGRFALPACSTNFGRLHVARLQSALSQCPIGSLTGSRLEVPRVGGQCCIDPDLGFRTLTPVVLFPRDDASSRAKFKGPTWRVRLCTPLTGGACGCTLSDTTKPGYDAPPPASNATGADFVGGIVAVGTVDSFFVDPTTRKLMLLNDLGSNGLAVQTEYLPNVVAFGTRLGYDGDPVDGVLEPLVQTPDATELDALRVVRVGLGLGARVADDRATSAFLFGNPLSVAGKRVVVVEGNATLRAIGVFQ